MELVAVVGGREVDSAVGAGGAGRHRRRICGPHGRGRASRGQQHRGPLDLAEDLGVAPPKAEVERQVWHRNDGIFGRSRSEFHRSQGCRVLVSRSRLVAPDGGRTAYTEAWNRWQRCWF